MSEPSYSGGFKGSITEGKCKGGQNPPLTSDKRPPAPGGSGGRGVSNVDAAIANVEALRTWAEQEKVGELTLLCVSKQLKELREQVAALTEQRDALLEACEMALRDLGQADALAKLAGVPLFTLTAHQLAAAIAQGEPKE